MSIIEIEILSVTSNVGTFCLVKLQGDLYVQLYGM
jgi:hypothetical protein